MNLEYTFEAFHKRIKNILLDPSSDADNCIPNSLKESKESVTAAFLRFLSKILLSRLKCLADQPTNQSSKRSKCCSKSACKFADDARPVN